MRRTLPVTCLATLVAVVSVYLLQGVIFTQANAQTAEQAKCATFRETGKTVCDPFLTFWQKNGGLRIFGYPISNPFREKSNLNGQEYQVQYFERAVFELHPENKAPYDVMLSQLGTSRFQDKYQSKDPSTPDERNLPLYPDAKDVRIELSPASVPDETVINSTTFRTADSPAAVIAYYKQLLEKNGWQFFGQKETEYLSYVFVAGAQQPVYSLSVEDKVTGGTTVVQLQLYKTLPK